MNIQINYEAKSLDEIKELLGLSKDSEVTVVATEPVLDKEGVTEAAPKYTTQDLQKLAVKANSDGKLSKVTSVLDKYDIKRISEVPEELTNIVGEELEEVLEG